MLSYYIPNQYNPCCILQIQIYIFFIFLFFVILLFSQHLYIKYKLNSTYFVVYKNIIRLFKVSTTVFTYIIHLFSYCAWLFTSFISTEMFIIIFLTTCSCFSPDLIYLLLFPTLLDTHMPCLFWLLSQILWKVVIILSQDDNPGLTICFYSVDLLS